MKLALIAFALVAVANAEYSDNTMDIALSFVKDCKGDYILCVKVNIFIFFVQ